MSETVAIFNIVDSCEPGKRLVRASEWHRDHNWSVLDNRKFSLKKEGCLTFPEEWGFGQMVDALVKEGLITEM